MVRYITKGTSNRVKICCIEDKNFETTTDYTFTFTNKSCCKEIIMTLNGDFCGSCAEFIFSENCDGSKDIALPRGIYKLEIVSDLDGTVLYSYDQIRVQ